MTPDYHIANLKQLREIIPEYPKLMDKRIKHQFDAYSREFLQAASLALFSCRAMENIELIDLKSNELSLPSDTKLTLQLAQPEQFKIPESARQINCSWYFLIAGIGHGLRINGVLSLSKNKANKARATLEIEIQQLYFHCSRAIVRSNFWHKQQLLSKEKSQAIEPHDWLSDASQHFLQHSSLAFICSRNIRGEMEISPRGDEAGFVKLISKTRLVIPERPGNKVAVTLRNILQHPSIKLILLTPNLNQTLHISGRASLSAEPDLLVQLQIKNKAPKLAIVIDVEHCHLVDSTSLECADIWNRAQYRNAQDLHSFPKIMNAHLHGESLVARTLQPVVSAIIKHDLKHLY